MGQLVDHIADLSTQCRIFHSSYNIAVFKSTDFGVMFISFRYIVCPFTEGPTKVGNTYTILFHKLSIATSLCAEQWIVFLFLPLNDAHSANLNLCIQFLPLAAVVAEVMVEQLWVVVVAAEGAMEYRHHQTSQYNQFHLPLMPRLFHLLLLV